MNDRDPKYTYSSIKIILIMYDKYYSGIFYCIQIGKYKVSFVNVTGSSLNANLTLKLLVII